MKTINGIPQDMLLEIAKWTGVRSTELSLNDSTDETANLVIENRYEMCFSRELSHGKGSRNYSQGTESSLIQSAINDIKLMSEKLQNSVAMALLVQRTVLYPQLSPEIITDTGTACGISIICNICGGTSKNTCYSCNESLRMRCTALGCLGGKVSCGTCSGTGQVKEQCYSCHGTRGTHSQAATHSYQVYNPNNTWEYQQRQAATGGQWVPCTMCGGSGGSQKSCTNYGCSYGKVNCVTCRGDGSVDCSTCGRTGKVICVDCSLGYNHVIYQPTVSIKHTNTYTPDNTQSKELQRICVSNKACIAILADFIGNANYTQDGTIITRFQAMSVRVKNYQIKMVDTYHTVLMSLKSGKILDWGELGDTLLREPSHKLAITSSKSEVKDNLSDCLRSPVHCFGVVSLAIYIGLATLMPWYRPKPAALNMRFIEKTQFFISPKFGIELITQTSMAMRRIFLTSHVLSLTAACIVLLAVWLQVHYQMPDVSSVTLLKIGHYGILSCLFFGEGYFVWRLIKTPMKTMGHLVKDNDIVGGLVMKSPAHWLCIAIYLTLLWGIHQLVR